MLPIAMSSHLRLRCSTRALVLPRHAMPFSNGRVLRADSGESSAQVAEAVKPKRPIGGFRGGIFGFLLGFSLASSFASYHLLEEYRLASSTMQASVEELHASTQKISAHVRRIEAVEKDLNALVDSSAAKEDVSKLRAEIKKTYDGLHVEFLDLRAHVWGMQQDLHGSLKNNSTRV
ncbi:uncharacterized protein EI90DRAFT_3035320 [Cantharellus anzutake]|uniref:uncharacterized protein n=1 Tax=Cantharellus anzutake TaxID=1750568 RepID=UPI001903C4B6|nr:uncharacterized protein EI90DRAFT_3035320 [Cantharellus anzutake]KAF8340370.1 hypothetical protein EI90DRAFT_3035320 [Cantharellus anzutake]